MLYVDFDLLDCSQRLEFCCRIYAVDAKVWITVSWQPSGGVTTHTECSVGLHLRQHTTPPFSFAKTDFIQSSLTSRENFCFGFQLNDLQSPRS